MGVVMRPRFGRPCYECSDTIPTQRLNELAALATMKGRTLLPSDRLCVACEKRRRGEATVTRKPRV